MMATTIGTTMNDEELFSPVDSGKIYRVSEPELAEFEPPKHVALEIELLDGTKRWYNIRTGQGWKIDPTTRCLIINKGLGRIHVPLDNVCYFSPVRVK